MSRSGSRSARSSAARASSSRPPGPGSASSRGGPTARAISRLLCSSPSLSPEAKVTRKREEAALATDGPVCSHLDQIEVTALPEKIDGCEECLKIGSGDSSPNKHATAHERESGHPIVRSAEPGEDWSWCYLDEVAFSLSPT